MGEKKEKTKGGTKRRKMRGKDKKGERSRKKGGGFGHIPMPSNLGFSSCFFMGFCMVLEFHLNGS